MKIIKDYSNSMSTLIEIKCANYIGDCAIRILFSDGKEKLVDFKPFLQHSLHPSIRKYLDEEKFKQFKIIDGNLNWNNYDMIFPLENLYDGKI